MRRKLKNKFYAPKSKKQKELYKKSYDRIHRNVGYKLIFKLLNISNENYPYVKTEYDFYIMQCRAERVNLAPKPFDNKEIFVDNLSATIEPLSTIEDEYWIPTDVNLDTIRI
jgi:hypothetical protein